MMNEEFYANDVRGAKIGEVGEIYINIGEKIWRCGEGWVYLQGEGMNDAHIGTSKGVPIMAYNDAPIMAYNDAPIIACNDVPIMAYNDAPIIACNDVYKV